MLPGLRKQAVSARGLACQRMYFIKPARPARIRLPGIPSRHRKLLMQTFIAYTNRFTETETLRDLHQRGRAVRLHPEPASARDDSRPEDTIVAVTFRIPDGASFVLYSWDDEEFSVYAQGPDFAAVYAEAAKAMRSNPLRALSTAIRIAGAHAGSTIVPVAKYATTLTAVSAATELAAA